MTVLIGVVAVLVLVVGVVTVLLLRRRGGDEMHSVEGYKHTLETLEVLRSRSTSPSVRVLRHETPSPGGRIDASSSGAPDGPDGTDGPDADGPGGAAGAMRFDDHDGRSSGEGTRDALPAVGPRQNRRAMSAMNRRPRSLGAPVLVAVAVLVLVVVMVVTVGARGRTPGHHNAATTTTTVHPRASRHHSSSGAHHDSRPSHPTTTTTVPSRYEPQPASVTGNTATYTPPASSYALSVSASPTGACWLQITEQGSGTTVYAQTLEAGQTESLTLSGAATVDLGAPNNVTLSLDHQPLQLPPGYLTPFTVTLQPPAAGA